MELLAPGFGVGRGDGWYNGRKVSSLAATVALPPCSLPYRHIDSAQIDRERQISCPPFRPFRLFFSLQRMSII